MPFFTVIIPTYNRAVLLARAIQSVLRQTFTDFELIVVDDHSTDGTASVVENIDDTRVIYMVNGRAKGSAGAKNTGVARSRADWIAFLDDDDYWLPEKLERQHQKIMSVDDGFGLVYTLSSDLKDGMLLNRREKPVEGFVFLDMLFNDYIGTASCVAVRKRAVEHVGGFDERFPSKVDTDLYIRLAKNYKVACIREVLAIRDLAPNNRISRSARKKLNANLLFYRKYHKYLIQRMKLKSRALSNVFANALVEGQWKHVIRTFPYALVAILYDSKRLRYLARRIGRAVKRGLALLTK